MSPFTIAALAVGMSRLIGPRFGKWAEVIGGVGLFCLGTSILIEHLSA